VGGLIALFLLFAFLESARGDSVELFHASSAGSRTPNLGLDIPLYCKDAPRLQVCAGPVFASNEFSDGYTLTLREQFGDYRFGIGYMTDITITPNSGHPQEARANMYFSALRVVQWKRIETGIGLTYWQNTNRAMGANWNFGISIGYKW
jgi:hypothetical protein